MSGADDWAEWAEAAALALLGEPTAKTPREWRWGRKGSLAFDLRKSAFFDNEAGEGGGVLWLVRRETGAASDAEARRWLMLQGIAPASNDNEPTPRRDPRPVVRRARADNDNAAEDAETAEKRALAARQWAEARPIEGTPGAAYLRGRGLTRWPSGAVRWCQSFAAYPGDRHPLPAILFPATDAAGAVVAVQAVRLSRAGRKIEGRAKTSLGPIGAGFLRLPGRGPLHIAEGPETALSVWEATGAPVLATLGPITARRIEAAPVAPAGLLVLAGDAAAPGSPAARSLDAATAAGLARGLAVRVAVPDGAPGTDWNDALQALGAEAVRDLIAAARIRTPEAWGEATAAAPVGTIFDARRRVADAFGRWAASVPGFAPDAETPAPVLAVRVSTGVGKSYTARRSAVDLVRELRAAGDGRAVVVAVPRHNLGAEFAADLAEIAHGQAVAVYRGRSADDPEAEGEKMCRRHDEAAEVQKAGAEVEKTLCRQGEVRCPFYDACGYLRQRRARADIWLVPHAVLWREPPRMIEPAALVVDEDASGGAYGGFEGAPVRLSLDDLARPLNVPGDLDDTADLAAVSGRLARVLRAGGDGRVTLAAIRAEGLAPDDMADARRLAFKAIRAPMIDPATPADVLAAELARIAPDNRNALRRARLFGLIRAAMDAGAEAVPGIFCETIEAKEGERFAAVRLRWRNEIAAGWNVPTLLASATARAEVLRVIWPALGDVIEAEAIAPAVTVRQITDRAFGAATVCPDERAPETVQRHARNTRARLLRYIEARADALGGRVLLIAQERTIAALRAEGLPETIETAHFNALSGLDGWRDVRGVILLGRTMPAPSDVENRAEVLAGRPVDRLPGWYPAAPAFLNMRGMGKGPAVVRKGAKGAEPVPGTDRHPDPLAEAIRWQIAEGELLQALGRGRGVNRADDAPLAVDILTAVPLPVAVDEAGPFEAFEPTPGDVMAARGVVVLDTAAKGAWGLVAAILPDLFPTPDAARKAMERLRGQNPIRIPIGICPRNAGAARVRMPGTRSGNVPLAIRARSEAEARDLLARVLPGAELLEFVPPKVPEAESWADARREVLAVVRSGGEAMADARLRAMLAEAINDNRAGRDARLTAHWWRAGWWRDAVGATVARL
jgi:putative DNA primase/helicase